MRERSCAWRGVSGTDAAFEVRLRDIITSVILASVGVLIFFARGASRLPPFFLEKNPACFLFCVLLKFFGGYHVLSSIV